MKKTKLSCTLGLMLFCANINAMEYSPDAKKIKILSCMDYDNNQYTQFQGGVTGFGTTVVRDSLNVNGKEFRVSVPYNIVSESWDPMPVTGVHKGYDYPHEQSLEDIRFVPQAYQDPLNWIFTVKKKQIKEMFDKKYIQIMQSADDILRNQQTSFFSKVTKYISKFFYGLIGRKTPMPTPICDRVEPLLKDLNNKMLEYYFTVNRKFDEKDVTREFPKMKELAQRFRHKFTFQGGNSIPFQAPEEQHRFRF
jgi:hypothetical protein